MRKGRPKNKQKSVNRRHTIILSEKAENIYQELEKRLTSMAWIHAYLSARIVKDFSNLEEDAILQQIENARKKIDELKIRIADLNIELEGARSFGQKKKFDYEKEIMEIS